MFAEFFHGRGVEDIRAGLGAIESKDTHAIVSDRALNEGKRGNGWHHVILELFPTIAKSLNPKFQTPSSAESLRGITANVTNAGERRAFMVGKLLAPEIKALID